MNTQSRGAEILDALGEDFIEGLGLALELRPDESMARHTTLRLGGPADLWVRPATPEALSSLLARTHALGVPVTFVGGGTNLLVRDGGIRGVVVNLGRMNAVGRPDPEQHPGRVEVESGASTGRLLSFCARLELGGVEFLGGVPGSVGGGLIMNAGTYLGEFTDVVTEVQSMNLRGEWRHRTHAECGFRYRDSDLPRDEVTVRARLELTPRPRAEIDEAVGGLRARRKEREPTGVGNNGSTFKNPPGDYAGRLIEAAGLKGLRRGGAFVSPKHANWLVVDKGAEPPCRSADLLELIAEVAAAVEAQFGVQLQREVKILGED